MKMQPISQNHPRLACLPFVVTLLLTMPASSSLAKEAASAEIKEKTLVSEDILLSFDGDSSLNKTESGIAIKGYDVVAFFTEKQAVKGSENFKTVYQDAVFLFSSKENKQKFLKDPEDYIPAFGGFCALGVSNGYKDDMHPHAFSIVKGRLYFNLTPRIHRYWEQNMEIFIQRANHNWPYLKDAPGYGRTDGR